MTNDTQTIPLWPLTTAQAERLVDAAARRQMEASLGLGDRPDGMRLSTDCPTRRVKQVRDQRLRFTLDDGLARRGFFAEDLAEAVGLLDHCELQVEIPWGVGNSSAWDAVRPGGTPVSLKSTTRPDATPTAANRRQDARMLAADPNRGTRVEVWMIDTSRLEARGPYWHEFTQDELAKARAELRAVDDAHHHYTTNTDGWDDPTHWMREYALECTCGGCFPRAAIDANATIERHVHTYWVMRQRIADAKEQQDAARAAMLAAADLLGVERIDAYTQPLRLSKGKRGWTIRERAEDTPSVV